MQEAFLIKSSDLHLRIESWNARCRRKNSLRK